MVSSGHISNNMACVRTNIQQEKNVTLAILSLVPMFTWATPMATTIDASRLPNPEDQWYISPLAIKEYFGSESNQFGKLYSRAKKEEDRKNKSHTNVWPASGQTADNRKTSLGQTDGGLEKLIPTLPWATHMAMMFVASIATQPEDP